MLKINRNSEMAKPQYMRFANDDDFYNFCVVPQLILYDGKPDRFGNCKKYYTFNFTDEYNKAVADGYQFMIKDMDSKIVKRGVVSLGMLSRPVDNLLPCYFEDPQINDDEM